MEQKYFYKLAMELQQLAIEAGQFVSTSYHPITEESEDKDRPFFAIRLSGHNDGFTCIIISSEWEDNENFRQYQQGIDFIEKHNQNE